MDDIGLNKTTYWTCKSLIGVETHSKKSLDWADLSIEEFDDNISEEYYCNHENIAKLGTYLRKDSDEDSSAIADQCNDAKEDKLSIDNVRLCYF